jgi:hypothetical protein
MTRNHRAALTVARLARDPDDARLLLDALGLLDEARRIAEDDERTHNLESSDGWAS